jgi:hypothetical protein
MSDLKPPLTGYSLWFMAKEEHHRSLQTMVDDLLKYGTRRFEAHATLIGLLEMTDEAAVLRGAEVVALDATSFDVEIIGTASRDRYFQSVFLTCVPSPEASRLNERARAIFGHQNDPPFMLHWSALYGDMDSGLKKAIRRDIENRFLFPMTATIDAIAVVDCTGYPAQWKIVRRFPLK